MYRAFVPLVLAITLTACNAPRSHLELARARHEVGLLVEGFAPAQLARLRKARPSLRVRVLNARHGLYEVFGADREAIARVRGAAGGALAEALNVAENIWVDRPPERNAASSCPRVGANLAGANGQTIEVGETLRIRFESNDDVRAGILVAPPDLSRLEPAMHSRGTTEFKPDALGLYTIGVVDLERDCTIMTGYFAVTANPGYAGTAPSTQSWPPLAGDDVGIGAPPGDLLRAVPPTPLAADPGAVPPTPLAVDPRAVPPTPLAANPGAVPSTPLAADPGAVPSTPLAADPGAVPPTPLTADPGAVPPTPIAADPGAVPPTPLTADPGAVPPTPIAADPGAVPPTPLTSNPGAVPPTPLTADPGAVPPTPANSLPTPDHLAQLHVPAAQRVTRGEGVVVAVLDSGIDYNNPALWAKVRLNTAEIPANHVDDDLNGYVDDYVGVDVLNSDNHPFDDEGHGSHVAGLIASEAFGVAPATKIIPVKVAGPLGGDIGSVAAGIFYAVDRGAHLINLSLGGTAPPHPILAHAIAYAEARGVAVIVAAGNGDPNVGLGVNIDDVPVYPASFGNANVIAVASAAAEDSGLEYYSNFGARHVSVCAPGGTPDHPVVSLAHANPRLVPAAARFGTSMAAPLASGIAALVRALAPTRIKQILRSAGPASPGLDGVCASGRYLDALAAVEAARIVSE